NLGDKLLKNQTLFCTWEDDREWSDLDIQGRGCNEVVHPWTMTVWCVRRMRARRESRSWRRLQPSCVFLVQHLYIRSF
ncbi:Os10g0357700, partial [Oryza sativa Japonica Group]